MLGDGKTYESPITESPTHRSCYLGQYENGHMCYAGAYASEFEASIRYLSGDVTITVTTTAPSRFEPA